MKKTIIISGMCLTPLLSLIPSLSYAESLSTQVSGFGRIGYTHADQQMNYAYSNQDFDLSMGSWFSLQFDSSINENIRTSLQLTTKGAHDYKPHVQNAYLEYSLADYQTNLYFGRFRIPSFFYSEYVDIGYTYPMFRPNDGVYTYISMYNMTGISARSYLPIGEAFLEVQPFLGIAHILAEDNLFGDIDLTEAIGLALRYELDDWAYRVSYATSKTEEIDSPLYQFIAHQRARQTSLGALYQGGEHYFNFEAVMINLTGSFADVYATSAVYGYQFDEWMPYVSVSHLESIDNDERQFLPSVMQRHRSTSYSIGSRYELNDNVALKFDLTYADFHDTTGIVPDNTILTDNGFELQFQDVTLYSFAIDFIF